MIHFCLFNRLPACLASRFPATMTGANLIFHTIRPGGGMERYVLDIIPALARPDRPLRVITQALDWPGPPPANVEFAVSAPSTPVGRLNNWLFERNALRLCRQDWPTLAISRVPGADLAIVGGTHLGHLRDKGRQRPGIFDRLTLAHERGLYAGARAVVAHSARVAGEIADLYGVSPDRIHTLYPPVDTRLFSLAARSDRAATRKSIGVGDDDFLLLFPSNNHTLKGADLILAALSHLQPRPKLAVAGKTSLAGPGVINLGYRSDMPALYAAADSVILASRYEAFGLVGPEAILCGTPVLFADTVGAIEVLSDRACIRFERTVEGLLTGLRLALERHAAGTLALGDPGPHILYPVSIEAHVQALTSLLQR